MASTDTGDRRGDLDALRAFAMLLGIALHASTSFYGSIWPVHDDRQSGLLPLLFAVIHGFRMPLFFLLSGFFTMLLFRRRGLEALLRQRLTRIALPLALAMVTILPVCRWLEERGLAAAPRDPLVAAVVGDDVEALRDLLAAGAGVDARDRVFHRPVLSWATMAGATETAAFLCDAGADVNAADPVGTTSLHQAAFCGRADIARVLLDRGASPAARSVGGAEPIESLARSPTLAAAYVRMEGLPEVDVATIAAGRQGVRELLERALEDRAEGSAAGGDGLRKALERAAARYWTALSSGRFLVDPGDPTSLHLVDSDVFGHLWFLWYLCWMVAAFAVAATAGFLPDGRGLWWFLPASCVCQAFMELPHGQLYGPDLSFGILPLPHLLGYYGCFFFFGVALFARDGAGTRFGSRWPLLLPLALVVLFPAGIATLASRPASTLLQPAFAWAMSAGLVGLFRRIAPAPNALVAWFADASYWMYLAHLPLVIALQSLVRGWQAPVLAKFLLVISVTTVILLVAYRFGVRHSLVGRILNGPRPAPGGGAVAGGGIR